MVTNLPAGSVYTAVYGLRLGVKRGVYTRPNWKPGTHLELKEQSEIGICEQSRLRRAQRSHAFARCETRMFLVRGTKRGSPPVADSALTPVGAGGVSAPVTAFLLLCIQLLLFWNPTPHVIKDRYRRDISFVSLNSGQPFFALRIGLIRTPHFD